MIRINSITKKLVVLDKLDYTNYISAKLQAVFYMYNQDS